MTFSFSAPRSSVCASCLRSILSAERRALRGPSAQQIRGKKKMPRDPNILVKLRADIPGYGPKDTIMPIARGRMRNLWYPNALAEYVTHARRKLVQDQVVERNSSFMKKELSKKKKGKDKAPLELDVAPKVGPALGFLQPERSLEIVQQIIPERLDFYRKLNLAASPDQPTSSADGAPAPAGTSEKEGTPTPAPTQTSIFGSVSTADIADNLRAVLAMEAGKEGGIKDAARVVLTPPDIQIVPSEQHAESVDGTRIKAVGDYDIDINVRGAEVVRRRVRIAAEDAEEGVEPVKVASETQS